MPGPLYVRKSISIHATVFKVWDVLTRPHYIKQYMFNSDVVSDWRPGSEITFKGQMKGKEVIFVRGHITRLEPLRVFEYTCFGPDSGLEDIPPNRTQVTYVLISQGGDTLLNVTQGDFSLVSDGSGERRFADATKGWEYVLEGLKNVAEGK